MTQLGKFLSVEEAAKRLGVTVSFVYGQCYGGKVPYYRFGPRNLRIRETSLKRYMESRSYGA